MPKETFAGRIRRVMRMHFKGCDEITYADLAEKLDLVSDEEKQPLYNAMRDFIKRGEVIRIRRGAVRYNGRNYDPHPAGKTRCMLRLIRANRRSTVAADDLIANCKVERSTAKEYLNMLVRRGMMRRIPMSGNRPSKYKMIDDPGPNLVRNDENAEKMRRIREVRKLAREALDAIQENLDIAVAAVAAIGEEDA